VSRIGWVLGILRDGRHRWIPQKATDLEEASKNNARLYSFNAEEFAALHAISAQYSVSISYLIRHFVRYCVKELVSRRLTLFDIR
jgi:hypothetical protein